MENKDYVNAPQKETRFAVVMYGGISLAIYIHGVTQELYSMVRATAWDDAQNNYVIADPNDLKGAELVYRALGETLKTKFVVDILSGTSAGGINAVYLAKALVNNQSIQGLKDLWVNEGDISLLVNDRKSVDGLSGLKVQNPPSSLLNNQRMYYKLLDAIKKMGESTPRGFNGISPYVEELDLSITASDIRGLVLPLNGVEDARIKESRFKTVFQFHYSTKRAAGDSNSLLSKNSSDAEKAKDLTYSNHFTKEFDPFLAFAARSTSAIPPAFEPMRLDDIEPILNTSAFKEDYVYDPSIWKALYKDYSDAKDDFQVRSFGDGGYLDNKPFSYATDTLLRRRADLPVDRKLIYIEPSPEHPEDQPTTDERPDVIENVFAALVGLPRQEPIREDIKTIQERNKIIKRITDAIRAVNHSAIEIGRSQQAKAAHDKADWRISFLWSKAYMSDVIGWYGPGYPAYHNIRLESVLSNLSTAWARAMGWDEDSPQEKDLHEILHAWSARKYSTEAHGKEKEPLSKNDVVYSENDIMYRLDVTWRLRRIKFIQDMINTFLDENSGEQVEKILKQVRKGLSRTEQRNFSKPEEYQSEQYKPALLMLKMEFNNISAYLRACGREARARNQTYSSTTAELTDFEKKFGKAYVDELRSLKIYFETNLNDQDGSLLPVTNLSKLANVLRKKGPALDELDSEIATATEKVELLSTFLASRSRKKGEEGFLRKALTYASIRSRVLLGQKIGVSRIDNEARKLFVLDSENINLQALAFIQNILYYFFERYDYYDMFLFPIQYGTDASETDKVEVLRVSPEEATMIVDEHDRGIHKLAGIKLANFGAFFKKEWRQNDMLWGRLDGAEILIRELLKEKDQTTEKYEARLSALKENYRRLLASKLGFISVEDMDQKMGHKEYSPFNATFEAILQEDLAPRNRELLYQLVNMDKPVLDIPTTKSAESTKDEEKALKKKRAELAGLKKQDHALLRLIGNLDQAIADMDDKDKNRATLEKILKQIENKEKNIREELERKEKQKLPNAEQTNEVASKILQPQLSKIEQQVLQKFSFPNSDQVAGLKKLLSSVGDDGRLLDYFKLGYSIDQEFPPKETALSGARAARVIGKLLDGLSAKYSSFTNPAKWITAAGSIAVGIVQISLPNSLGNFLFTSYWVWLAYVLEIILWAGGAKFNYEAVSKMGAILFGVTFAVHMTVLILQGWMSRTLRTTRHKALFILLCVILFLLALVIIVTLGLGILDIWAYYKSGLWIPR